MTDRPQATATLLIENAQVRVTRYDFAPGAETGWHQHEMDYVITAVTDCNMRLEADDETKVVFTKKGTCYFRETGIRHNVINDSDAPMVFVECELKS